MKAFLAVFVSLFDEACSLILTLGSLTYQQGPFIVKKKSKLSFLQEIVFYTFLVVICDDITYWTVENNDKFRHHQAITFLFVFREML